MSCSEIVVPYTDSPGGRWPVLKAIHFFRAKKTDAAGGEPAHHVARHTSTAENAIKEAFHKLDNTTNLEESQEVVAVSCARGLLPLYI